MLGTTGHIALLISIISAFCSVVKFFSPKDTEGLTSRWLPRFFFTVHAAGVLVAVVCLFQIIYGHHFQYHYAWAHSSRALPFEYMISCFWEGQEGSFLTWVFLNAIIGSILLFTAPKRISNTTMGVFMSVQFCMLSMLLGVDLFGFEIGTSPFNLLRDQMDMPVFTNNPNFIPDDGSGLNPLLQNYWMIIHPPTIFLGFALALAPFSLGMGALIEGDHQSWVKATFPWVLMTAFVLSAGIFMGAYWAYETLNFGGYWNWDPVENAIYVPWLMWIAIVHLMIIYRKNEKVLRSTYALTIVSFILVVYSTFLTRSGILGDSSVHSFTDSGLFTQLALFVGMLVAASTYFLVKRWKSIPGAIHEEKPDTMEFWVFIGVMILSLASVQVLLTTSIPVFNAIGKLFIDGFNIAPPTNAVEYYTNFQYYFALLFCVLSVIAQNHYWKSKGAKVGKKLMTSAVLSMFITAVIAYLGDVLSLRYLGVFACAIFTLISGLQILWSIPRSTLKFSGGSVAHIGMAVCVLGILFSSAYSNIISTTDGFGKQEEASFNKLFMRDKISLMGAFEVAYRGQKMLTSKGEYIDRDALYPTRKSGLFLLKNDFGTHSKGDTVACSPFNFFYQLDYLLKGSQAFSLFPRIQMNPKMGVMASPDIRNSPIGDIYTHVSNFPNPGTDTWDAIIEFSLQVGETDTINGFPITLESSIPVNNPVGIRLEEGDVALDNKLVIQDLWAKKNIELHPLYLIKNTDAIRIYPDQISDPKIRVTVDEINPITKEHKFKIAFGKRDWVVVKSIEKPMISLVWIGGIMMCVGFGISLTRVIRE